MSVDPVKFIDIDNLKNNVKNVNNNSNTTTKLLNEHIVAINNDVEDYSFDVNDNDNSAIIESVKSSENTGVDSWEIENIVISDFDSVLDCIYNRCRNVDSSLIDRIGVSLNKLFNQEQYDYVMKIFRDNLLILRKGDIIDINTTFGNGVVVTLISGDKIYIDEDGSLSDIHMQNFELSYDENQKLKNVNYIYDENRYNLNKIIPFLTNVVGIYNTDDGGFRVKLSSGMTIYMSSEGNVKQIKLPSDVVLMYDEFGNLTNGYKVNGLMYENISCFDGTSEQYGGSQMDFKNNVEDLLQDEIIISMLEEAYPDATMEQYELYLYRVCNVGCGYTAAVNAIFEEYSGRESEFRQIFGFDMYTVNSNDSIDYNYEYLILDYFNYIWSDECTIEETIIGMNKDVTDGAIGGRNIVDNPTGGTTSAIIEEFELFLSQKYNVSVLVNHLNETINENNYIDVYRRLVDENYDSIIIWCQGADLFDLDGNLCNSNVGSHAMTVTGIHSDGRLIVSSWGNEYIIDLSRMRLNSPNGCYVDFKIIDFRE